MFSAAGLNGRLCSPDNPDTALSNPTQAMLGNSVPSSGVVSMKSDRKPASADAGGKMLYSKDGKKGKKKQSGGSGGKGGKASKKQRT